jgi:23S rRNA (cytidine1920-2'-O)/16S rRNA (cytidine1409-2'-O)-methyltransferase
MRKRLDKLLVERGISTSRERAAALIMTGAVIVGERVVDKAGMLVNEDCEVRIKGEENPYVSRGGLKLAHALQVFGIQVKDLVVLDVGASTGGFTDCLLHEGAKKVYALDVGYGQLAWRLRNDKRVVAIERTNIRHFDGSHISDDLDMATIDTSFISLKLVIPAAMRLLKDDAVILALIKPQFEVGKEEVGRRGVVTSPALHEKVITDIELFCRGLCLAVLATCESPLLGPAGNKEFFIYLKKMRQDN